MEARCCDCGEPIAESMGFVKASVFLRCASDSMPPSEQPARCYKCVERLDQEAKRRRDQWMLEYGYDKLVTPRRYWWQFWRW